MADDLKPEEKFYKSITTVKLKDRPIFKGSSQVLKNIGYDLSNLVGKSKEKEGLRLFVEKEELRKTLQGELKNLTLLEDLTWNNLSNSDRQVVLNLVKDIQELSGVDLGVDHIKEDTKTVLTKCMEVVGKVGEQAKSLSEMKSFSHDNLSGLLSQMDQGSIDYYHEKDKAILVPSKEDLDIVTALKMTGIDLEFDGTKWELKSATAEKGDVSFVPTKDGKPLQVFGNENIQFLLNNYLNVPKELRTQTVVPSKLLQVYVNEYERQAMEGKDPSSLEGGLVKQDVARQRNIFSMNSNEFQITKLLDRDTIMRNAQKMAMVSSFEEIVKSAKDTSKISDSIISTIDSMSSDPAYKNIIKGLNKLVPMLDGMGDRFEDATEFEGGYNVDFVAEYDRQIEYLKSTGAPAEHTDALKKAKAEFEATVAVQQVYWQSKLVELANGNNGNVFSAGLATAINESMGFAVMQNNGGEFVMANGETVQKFLEEKNLSASLYQQLRERAQSKGGNAAAQTAQTQQNQQGNPVTTNYPEIFFDIVDNAEAVADYSNMRLYQAMWQEGCFFDIDFAQFKKEHPDNATIDAYANHFAQEKDVANPFDPELVKDAYCLVHPNEVSKEQLNKVQSRIDNFNKQLLLTDLMLATFSPDELMKYDSMEDAIKTPFLSKKYQEAMKAFDELQKNPVAYQEAIEKAKKRHEAGIVGSVIQHLWSEAAAAEKESGNGPVISKAVDAFLNSLAKEQKKNNEELAKNGEPVVKNGENVAENEAEEETKQSKGDTTYGKMFPSGPNVNKFLKRMKPYHAKEITKYFIEPLMEDLDNIIINLDNYYAKVEATKDHSYTNDAISPEQKKAMEENFKKQEQAMIAVKQRDFEASAFIPAAMMFDSVKADAKGKPEYEHAAKLQQVFKYMSSTDPLNGTENLGVATPQGKDVRDELRGLALRVCGGEFKGKGSVGVEQTLMPILTKYGVAPQVQEDIKDAFQFMTPELLAFALEPISQIKDDKTMVVGEKIPYDIVATTSDKDRWEKVGKNFDINDEKNKAAVENLSILVGTIYRTKDETQIDKADIDKSFEVKLGHESAEFSQVKDTEDMKALIMKMRQQNGLAPTQETADNEAEMGD